MGLMFSRWRWGLFVGGLSFGLYIWFAGVRENPNSPILIGTFLHGLVVMAISFLLVATNMAQLAALPFTRFIDSLYLPGGSPDKALLKYELPIYYERHYRGDEAAAAYEAIIKSYPDQIQAYAGVIRVSETLLQDRERASHWRTLAERHFGTEEIYAAVAKTADEWHAERMRSALAPAPSQ